MSGVDAKAQGAAGDGVTDDGRAIQASCLVAVLTEDFKPWLRASAEGNDTGDPVFDECYGPDDVAAFLASRAARLMPAPGWIPVGERLPPTNQMVDVWCVRRARPEYGGHGGAWREPDAWRNESGHWACNGDDETIQIDEGDNQVTHWMPVPCGP